MIASLNTAAHCSTFRTVRDRVRVRVRVRGWLGIGGIW